VQISSRRNEVNTLALYLCWKKVPDGVTYILTNALFRFAHTLSENSVPITLIVNTDQTLVIYTAGASETYAPKGSKQVKVVGKDEKQGFTVVVEISMSGEVLSRTQVLLTKIAQLCKEICDMEKTIKMNNIVPRLPESTINTNCNKDRLDGPDIDDPCEKGCNNSSHSNPNPHESDLSYSTDKVLANEERPIQTLSTLIPDALNPSLSSSPASSTSSISPSAPVSSDSSESLSDDQLDRAVW
jgi:hypothetical protein